MGVRILEGDAREVLKTLPDESVQCCITSPPYWSLRDYDVAGQIGLEADADTYVMELARTFLEVRRILREDGTLWINIGDTRMGGGLLGIPGRVASVIRAAGFFLINDVIWHKQNIVPVNAPRRLTCDHEYFFFFFFAKGDHYFDGSAIKEPLSPASAGRYKYAFSSSRGIDGRMAAQVPAGMREEPAERAKRTVWRLPSSNYKGAHYATFPPELVEPVILACTRPGDMVLDPFSGAGTTGLVANRLGREYIGIELNAEYAEQSRKRITDDSPLFGDVA